MRASDMSRILEFRWPQIAVMAAVVALSLSAFSGISPVLAKSGGGVVTFAEQPGGAPNYISPLEGDTEYSTPNNDDFSFLTYRPLYWMCAWR
jgi:peptide/nickel transport system substrate-binding protein